MGDVKLSEMKGVSEFQEDSRAPLIELNNTDSTELWLIQWPKDQVPDLDGQQMSLNLQDDSGHLGSFETSFGKSYEVVSFGAQEPATVFQSSAQGSNIVGNITRRVSFVNYLEPNEVPKDDTKKLKQLYEKSAVTSLNTSAYNFVTPTKSSRPAPSSARTIKHSARRSSLSEENVRSKDSKVSKSSLHSGLDSEHSGEKSKKRKKHVS
ncbi:mediator-associated protein 2-like [Rutidosis leptorrhynchoides]|uniref:mediator-associated protein 2-like n=1 Tax=Rutidosis leptorrhynchoides TaxID=125765 RepID=UPI003A99D9C7